MIKIVITLKMDNSHSAKSPALLDWALNDIGET